MTKSMAVPAPVPVVPSTDGGSRVLYRREPLSPAIRRTLLASVIIFHVGCGWALTQLDPPRIVVGEAPAMEVRMVSAEPPAPPEPQIDIPLPQDTPPPDLKPELQSMIQPPPPDLPPPVFPVEAPPPPPPKPKPKPQVHKPPPPRPHPSQAPVQTSVSAQPGPPAPPAAPKTVGASQVSFLVRPNPVYPSRARRNNEQGVVMVRVLIDVAGRPTNVSLQASSGHPALDESALSAVKAAQFRPYSERGVPQPVWVNVPIKFVLQ
jgi:protein TonB